MSEWTIYWITRLDNLLTVARVAAIISTAFFVVVLVTTFVESIPEEDVVKRFRSIKRWSFLPFLAWGTVVLIPSTKEMAAILVIPVVANSEAVQEIGSDLHTLASEWLKAQIEEVKK